LARKESGLELTGNELFITTPGGDAPIWRRGFLLHVLRSFDLPTLHWQSYYFLRSHFAFMSATCQVAFEIKLYQRMLKWQQNNGLGSQSDLPVDSCLHRNDS